MGIFKWQMSRLCREIGEKVSELLDENNDTPKAKTSLNKINTSVPKSSNIKNNNIRKTNEVTSLKNKYVINDLGEINYNKIDSLISDIVDNYMCHDAGNYKEAIRILKGIAEPMMEYAATNDIRSSTDTDKFLQYIGLIFLNLAVCYEVCREFENGILYSSMAIKVDLNTDVDIFQKCTRIIERCEKCLNLENTFCILKLAAEYDVPSHLEHTPINSTKYIERQENSIKNLNGFLCNDSDNLSDFKNNSLSNTRKNSFLNYVMEDKIILARISSTYICFQSMFMDNELNELPVHLGENGCLEFAGAILLHDYYETRKDVIGQDLSRKAIDACERAIRYAFNGASAGIFSDLMDDVINKYTNIPYKEWSAVYRYLKENYAENIRTYDFARSYTPEDHTRYKRFIGLNTY